MKISFKDSSYINCQKSADGDKIVILLSAKDGTNPLKRINNACELTLDEFKQLISDIKL